MPRKMSGYEARYTGMSNHSCRKCPKTNVKSNIWHIFDMGNV